MVRRLRRIVGISNVILQSIDKHGPALGMRLARLLEKRLVLEFTYLAQCSHTPVEKQSIEQLRIA